MVFSFFSFFFAFLCVFISIISVSLIFLISLSQVGSYCGADGVDSWPKERWTKEIANHQVLVLVHQVFLDILAHSYFSLSHAALLILDECHHAQVKKDHPYSSIMREWYHKLKGEGQEMPKVFLL